MRRSRIDLPVTVLEGERMRRILRDQRLTLTMFGLFVVFRVGQSVPGLCQYNNDQREHGEPPVSHAAYVRTGHFGEATFEKWESEYLQMALYVLLATFLFQRGPAESRGPDGREPVDEDPREAMQHPGTPWPIRRGGEESKRVAATHSETGTG